MPSQWVQEKEAGKMWCPAARAMICAKRLDKPMTYFAYNRMCITKGSSGEQNMQALGCQCLGSECMKWEWKEEGKREADDHGRCSL